jgi:cobalt transporter subunit CbtB
MNPVLYKTVTHSSASDFAIAHQWPAIGILLFGLVFLYFAGFSNVRQAHNATHDTRHASGFPCH